MCFPSLNCGEAIHSRFDQGCRGLSSPSFSFRTTLFVYRSLYYTPCEFPAFQIGTFASARFEDLGATFQDLSSPFSDCPPLHMYFFFFMLVPLILPAFFQQAALWETFSSFTNDGLVIRVISFEFPPSFPRYTPFAVYCPFFFSKGSSLFFALPRNEIFLDWA